VREDRGRLFCMTVFLLVATTTVLSLPLHADIQPESPLAPLFTLPNLEGEDVSLIDYRGQVVILDFWATWCDLCVQTFPRIQSLSETYADQGAVLLVVSLDKRGETARTYLIENEEPTDNVLWGSLEEAREVKDLFGVGGIAHTVVIDCEGYIRYSGHPLYLEYSLIEQLVVDGSCTSGSVLPARDETIDDSPAI